MISLAQDKLENVGPITGRLPPLGVMNRTVNVDSRWVKKGSGFELGN